MRFFFFPSTSVLAYSLSYKLYTEYKEAGVISLPHDRTSTGLVPAHATHSHATFSELLAMAMSKQTIMG